jgi:peptide-methionine (S)-S-oxide reductase
MISSKKDFMSYQILLSLLVIFNSAGCAANNKYVNTETCDSLMSDPSILKKLVLGGGCFWCIETIFQDIRGVEYVESGYSGGNTPNPTYQEVCTGKTGHAEVVRITYNPEVISLDQLLTVFFHIHDPTTLNRQGADIGTQYRSVIFYSDENEKNTAIRIMDEITSQKLWNDPLVTELSPLGEFYRAEEYHQNYYKKNPYKSYCSLVIAPKLRKFYRDFPHLLKDGK